MNWGFKMEAGAHKPTFQTIYSRFGNYLCRYVDFSCLSLLVVLLIGGIGALLSFNELGKDDYRVFRPASDVAEYAAKARLLRETGSFVTPNIYPLALAFPLADPFLAGQEQYFPTIDRGPLGTVVLATWQAFVGEKEVFVYGLGIVCYAAIWLLTFLIFVCIFRNGNASPIPTDAILPVFILASFLAYPVYTKCWLFGTEQNLVAAIFFLLAWLLCHDKFGFCRAILSGCVFGCVLLIRFELVVLALALLYFFLKKEPKDIRLLVVFYLSAFCMVLPWLVRNALVTGSPIFALQAYAEPFRGTELYHERFIYRQSEITVGLLGFVQEYGAMFVDKLLSVPRSLLTVASRLPSILPCVVLLLIPVFQKRPGNNVTSVFCWFMLLSFLIVGVTLTIITLPQPRHLFPLIPALHFGAALSYRDIVNRTLRISAFAFFVCCILAGLMMRPQVLSFERNMETNIEWQNLTEIIPPGDVLISDDDTVTAWMLNRSVIWAPLTQESWERVLSSTRTKWLLLRDEEKYTWNCQLLGKFSVDELISEHFEQYTRDNGCILYVRK